MVIPALLPLALFAVAVLGMAYFHDSPFGGARARRPSETYFTPPSRNLWYNGVALPKLSDLVTWRSTTGEHPGIVQIYVPLGITFPFGELQTIERDGAMPIVQIDYKQPVSNILAGRYDKILEKWGQDLRKMKEPVALSFGHEMNGNWFPWGCTRTTPGVFISAWRRMHQLLGSRNTMWVYTINRTNAGFKCGPMEYYPGNSYVNWIGIDGYLRQPADSFSSVFGPTVRELRRQTSKPILITEAGVLDSTGQASQIRDLYAEAYRSSVIGIVYFDQTTARGYYRPQDNPAALVTFRKEVARYGNLHTMR